MAESYETPVLYRDHKLLILDQTRLPGEEIYIEIKSKEDLWDAIYHLKVRGAPAIGVAAAYGLCVAAGLIAGEMRENAVNSRKESKNFDFETEQFCRKIEEAAAYINTARPTAVNLSWALKRMTACLRDFRKEKNRNLENWLKEAERHMLQEAEKIRLEDEEACRRMGEYGLSLLKPGMGILTHCNAGSLATARYGTCLSPVYLGAERGYHFKVFADETRPLLQGARLTCWELQRAGVDVTLICDNMASVVMKNGWIDAVVVGCDRMAANGDGANKIGTSGVAILAKEYGIPFYMFVPVSTIDFQTPSGRDIVIEQRDGREIYQMWYEKDMAPAGIQTYNPAFDVTEHQYITAVITEKGIVRAPYDVNLKKICGK